MAATLSPRASNAADAPSKPNVLLIVVDDLNTRLGCYGDKIAKTPNIDRLAQRAVRFDRAYCQSPLCNPSRTSFLSGRYPSTTGILDNDTPPRRKLGDVAFLPEHFRAIGYFTAEAGKVTHAEFDDAVHWDVTDKSSGINDIPEDEPKSEKGKKARQAREREHSLPEAVAWRALDVHDDETVDGRTARNVTRMLDQHRNGPFFIGVGFHKPHRPYEAPAHYFSDFPAEQMPLPQEPADIRAHVPPIAFDTYDDDAHMPETYKRHAIAAYYACIKFIDAQIGVILDQLDALKLWDNTIVILTSDHGYLLGEHGGMWRKMSLFEEATRVPLLIAAPGKKAGAVSSRTVELVDLYPTLTELTGIQPPSGLEGRSIAPLITDPERSWEWPAHTFTKHGKFLGQSVRTERWRYTQWGNDRKQLGAELYDHSADPKEWVNLASDEKFAGTLPELQKLLITVEK